MNTARPKPPIRISTLNRGVQGPSTNEEIISAIKTEKVGLNRNPTSTAATPQHTTQVEVERRGTQTDVSGVLLKNMQEEVESRKYKQHDPGQAPGGVTIPTRWRSFV